jgi:hypothetical protein
VKRWIQILAAAIVGAIVGLAAAPPMQKRWLGNELQRIRAKFYSKDHYAGAICLAALSELEAGKPESAKVFLARPVVTLYRDLQKESPSPEGEKIRLSIESLSEKSEVLKKELAKSSGNPQQ